MLSDVAGAASVVGFLTQLPPARILLTPQPFTGPQASPPLPRCYRGVDDSTALALPHAPPPSPLERSAASHG